MKEVFADVYVQQIKKIKEKKRYELESLSLNLNALCLSNKDKENKNKLNDFQIENIAESTINKCEAVVKYFSNLLGFELKGLNMKSSIQIDNESNKKLQFFSGYYKEMSMFVILLQLEVQLLIEILKGKNVENDDSELHVVKITPKGYDYSYINFSEDGVYINLENPKLEDYLKTLEIQKDQLFFLIGKILKLMGINIDEIETFKYLQDSMRNFYLESTEKYFFALFEKAVEYYTKKSLIQANEEFHISKYYYEILVFIRMISHNKPKTAYFFEISDCLDCEDFITLDGDSKVASLGHSNNCVLFTLLGGIYNSFKENEIIEGDLNTMSTIGFSKDAVEALVSFFPEILKFIIECSK